MTADHPLSPNLISSTIECTLRTPSVAYRNSVLTGLHAYSQPPYNFLWHTTARHVIKKKKTKKDVPTPHLLENFQKLSIPYGIFST